MLNKYILTRQQPTWTTNMEQSASRS